MKMYFDRFVAFRSKYFFTLLIPEKQKFSFIEIWNLISPSTRYIILYSNSKTNLFRFFNCILKLGKKRSKFRQEKILSHKLCKRLHDYLIVSVTTARPLKLQIAFRIIHLHITFRIAFCIYNSKKCKFAPEKLHEPGGTRTLGPLFIVEVRGAILIFECLFSLIRIYQNNIAMLNANS